MKTAEKVKEIYNNGQDEYRIKYDWVDEFANKKGWFIKSDNKYFLGNDWVPIGFYEWLINPKYKVFEVYKKYINDIIEFGKFIDKIVGMCLNNKQPEEIIKYLADRS
jgi:hypothetical protein